MNGGTVRLHVLSPAGQHGSVLIYANTRDRMNEAAGWAWAQTNQLVARGVPVTLMALGSDGRTVYTASYGPGDTAAGDTFTKALVADLSAAWDQWAEEVLGR